MSGLDALAAWEPGDGLVLRSAMEHRFRAAGATFERRGAWELPVAVPSEAARLERVGFADASHVGKLELRGGDAPASGDDREVIPVSPGRWIVLCPPGAQVSIAAELSAGRRLVADMTGAWSLVAVAGPEAERLLRRLGPLAEVPGAGSVAGVPGRVFRRAGLLWIMTATEFAQHLFDACADRSEPLGGGAAGLDAVARHAADALLGVATAGAAR